MSKKKPRRYVKSEPNRIMKTINPLRQFIKLESSGGIVLIACVIVAVILANSSLAYGYHAFWDTEISIMIAETEIIAASLRVWTADFLMFIFFLFVGLELKREALIGELTEVRNALLPVIAALGGMLAPVAIYVLFNPPGTEGFAGWAIPVATDIALVLGILSVFGESVPASLRVFLATLAVADDIGGVMVIGLFLSEELNFFYLALGLVAVVCLALINKIGVRNYVPYIAGGVLIWFFFFDSGIHPTIAGVLLAWTIPATTRMELTEFASTASDLVRDLCSRTEGEEHPETRPVFESMQTIEVACRDAQAPLQRVEYGLAAWIAFIIVPVFALANAGVTLESELLADGNTSVALGIFLGLVLGKPMGILLIVLLATRLGYVALPKGIDWNMMLGVGFLAGVALTVSTLIASLSFAEGPMLSLAKTSVLAASTVSALLGGYLISRAVRLRKEQTKPYSTPRVIAESTPPIAGEVGHSPG